MTDTQTKVMDHIGTATYIESFYWTNDRYPTLEEVVSYSSWSIDQLTLISELINKQLMTRGHPPFSFKTAKAQRAKKEIDPKFVAACSLICDPANKASLAAKLKLVPMKTSEWQVLLNDPVNQKYFKARINKAFAGADDSAKLSLMKNVEAGDLQSIKYFHEFTGIYRPNTETLLNLGVLLSQLMEILATFVSQDILLQIANRFEKVIEGHAVDESTEAQERIKEIVTTKNPLLMELPT